MDDWRTATRRPSPGFSSFAKKGESTSFSAFARRGPAPAPATAAIRRLSSSNTRKQERRFRESGTRKAGERRANRVSILTPTSEFNAAIPEIKVTDTYPFPAGKASQKIPLSYFSDPASPFAVKVYNKTVGADKFLMEDYYLIDKRYAKREGRAIASRYMLKVIVFVRSHTGDLIGAHGSYVKRDGTRVCNRGDTGFTTAIGSVSSGHYYNTSIRDAITAHGLSGLPGLEQRILASGLGEAREELRVRLSDIQTVGMRPACIVSKLKEANRFHVYGVIDITLKAGVGVEDLNKLYRKDIVDTRMDDKWRETCTLHYVAALGDWGERTRDFLRILN